MDPVWIAVPGTLLVGASLAALTARRLRVEAAALAAEVVGFGSLAAEAALVRAEAVALAARTASEPTPGAR